MNVRRSKSKKKKLNRNTIELNFWNAQFTFLQFFFEPIKLIIAILLVRLRDFLFCFCIV